MRARQENGQPRANGTGSRRVRKRGSMKIRTVLAAGALAASVLGAAPSASAGRPKVVVAIFTQSDFDFSETITLYGDGKYRQEEKQKEEPKDAGSRHGFSLRDLFLPDLSPALPASLREPKREGTWRTLDKVGGTPVLLKAGSALPPGAVVEMKGAMPFGLTWDNRLPYTLFGDRAVAAGAFKVGGAGAKGG